MIADTPKKPKYRTKPYLQSGDTHAGMGDTEQGCIKAPTGLEINY